MEKSNLKNVWGIYKILNTKNNKFYIGSSVNLAKRLYEHRRELNNNEHINKHLQSSWNKYGEEAFEFSIVEIVKQSDAFTNLDLRNLETEYIISSECYKAEIGYNIIPGGIGSLGLKCSEDKKRKISEANKGKIAWNKGIPMSEDQKQLLKTSKRSKFGKAIDIYNLHGDLLETLGSLAEVVDKYKVAKNTIMDQCKGRRNGKKYIFRYSGDPFILETNIEYSKNKTYGNTLFCIYDLNGILLHSCKYKKEVIFYLTGSDKRNGNIERKLKECVTDNTSVCLYNKYIIKFEVARNNGDIIDESRQSEIISEVSIEANGEA